MHVVFAGQGAQPVVHPVEGGLLGCRCRSIQADGRAADRRLDRGRLGNCLRERDPPQPAGAFGEIAGDVDGEGRVKFAHHRQCEIAVVAIAVIEGETGEAPREIAFGKPLMDLVHSDDVDIKRAKMLQHRAQEFRLDLEMMIGLKFGVAAGPHVVQHENDADTCENWSQQVVGSGKIEGSQPGADNGVAEQFHQL